MQNKRALQQTWVKWLKRVEHFRAAAEITSDSRTRAILLNLDGDDVADIFDTICPQLGNAYKEALNLYSNAGRQKKMLPKLSTRVLRQTRVHRINVCIFGLKRPAKNTNFDRHSKRRAQKENTQRAHLTTKFNLHEKAKW